jgi:Ni/Co efflux regulator RcnB
MLQIATISPLRGETCATGRVHFLLNANERLQNYPRRNDMKKFILAAVSASLVATPVLAAPFQYQGQDNRPRAERNERNERAPQMRHAAYRHDDRQMQKHYNWKRGDRFDSRHASNYRVIANPRDYRLHEAPRGYRWVQSGQDAVLVGVATGIIASVIANGIH